MKITIIELTRTSLKTHLFISPKKNPIKTGEYLWTSDALEEILTKIKKINKVKRIRVLLSEDLGYLMEIDIPADIDPKAERSYIFGIIVEKIPEILDDHDWDFIELARNKDNTKVRVFAPVEGIWKTFSQICVRIKLEIEAVEPVSLATQRNSNPIIGLAIKKDLKGKDEKVLNIVPEEINDLEDENKGEEKKYEKDKGKEKEKIEEAEDKKEEKVGVKTEEKEIKKNTSSLFHLILPVMLFSFLIFGVFYYWKLNTELNITMQEYSRTESFIPAKTEPSTLLPSTNLIDIKIKIVNQTNNPDSAEEMRLYLESLGYSDITIEEDATNPSSGVSLSIKGVDMDIENSLVENLSNKYELSDTVDTLSTDDEFGVIIYLGTN